MLMLSKTEFVNIINRLKGYEELQGKINDLFGDYIDNKENDFMNAGSVCIGHETIVVQLLESIFDKSGDIISWWIYEQNYGEYFGVGDLVDDDLNMNPDLSTAEKLYDYLILVQEKTESE